MHLITLSFYVLLMTVITLQAFMERTSRGGIVCRESHLIDKVSRSERITVSHTPSFTYLIH